MSEPIIATLIPRKPGGKHYYTYSVEIAGELIVKGSTNPEHDACRVLLSRGFTGTLLLQSCDTGKARTSIDIERGAAWRIGEEDRDGLRLRWIAPANPDSSPGTDESLEPGTATPEAA
jgi:hypothetical protein